MRLSDVRLNRTSDNTISSLIETGFIFLYTSANHDKFPGDKLSPGDSIKNQKKITVSKTFADRASLVVVAIF